VLVARLVHEVPTCMHVYTFLCPFMSVIRHACMCTCPSPIHEFDVIEENMHLYMYSTHS
jgi:aminopeptidase-like protein